MASNKNERYLISWAVVVSLGMFCFGFSLSSFSTTTNSMFYHYKLSGHQGFYMESTERFNSIVTAILPIGGALGVLSSGKMAAMDRRKAIMNIACIFILGSFISIMSNFYWLVLGRIIIGFASGAVWITAPQYISEYAPTDISGALSALNQIMFAFGIFIVKCFELLTPLSSNNLMLRSDNTWTIIFIIPALVWSVQLFLLTTVFDSDPPQLEDNSDSQMSDLAEGDGCFDLLSSPQRKTFLVGCGLSIVHQLTGMSWVIIFSTDMLVSRVAGAAVEQYAKFGSFLFGLVYFLGSLTAYLLLKKFGRRTLMLWAQLGMILSYAGLATFTILHMLFYVRLFMLAFTFFFQIGVGTIFWVYVSETMTPKGMGIAILINWMVTTALGAATPFMFKSDIGSLVSYCSLFFVCSLSLIFICIFIHETKGLNKQEIKNLMNGSSATVVDGSDRISELKESPQKPDLEFDEE